MDRQTMQLEVKKALSETVLLSDGRYGYIIDELPGSTDKWECHVCSRVINSERAMLMHLSHPLHMNKLRAPHHSPANFRKKTTKEQVKKNLEAKKMSKDEKPWVATDTIDPGEPIPPGMEDVVKKVCQIQESLDNHVGALIGIEYIIELISKETECEPKYICLLCEKKGDPRSVMVHLKSHNHALRYISCFFRTAGNALNLIPKTRENRKGLTIAVQEIAEEIEKIFGRLKPTTAILETFTQQKSEILRSIEEKEHFRETPTTTFMQYCTDEAIQKFAKIAELESLKPKFTYDENDILNQSNERKESILDRNKQSTKNHPQNNKNNSKPTEVRHPDGKLSFSIGKPERSFGRNRSREEDGSDDKKDNDDVIYVGSSINDPIEINSMSPISSATDGGSPAKLGGRGRSRSPRGNDRRRGGRSPYRRSPYRRRNSPSGGAYRDRYRSRSRSRSRSRGRYYRERDRLYRRDQAYPRDRRSRSKDRDQIRQDSRRRSDRRSISMERDRDGRRMNYPYKSTRPRKSPGRSPTYKSKYTDKSPEPKKKKVSSEYEKKMNDYRAKLHELEVEMESKLKFYRDRPEKHPQYSEEWKNFWNRRYKELQQSGKDPTGYDFKPEWIVYWDERVKQLHEEEVALKKEDLKELLPKEEKGPSSDLQDVSPPTPEHMRDITVDDIKNTWKTLTGSEIKAPKTHSPTPESKSPERRSPSPWDGKREKEERENSTRNSKSSLYVADPPIVHSLRMLSVLEQQLGSLGPKALDLLSKAILMEKISRNNSMKLLDEPEVHIFFETVKEKIRGQLIAGIVVRYLVNSCRSLITNIEAMLAANPLKPKQIPTYVPLQPEPVKVAGVGLVNKMAVAQQIAEVLVLQGRTDVDQNELEELINAVVGIASSNSNVDNTSLASTNNFNNSTKKTIEDLISGSMTIEQLIGLTVAKPTPVAKPILPDPPNELSALGQTTKESSQLPSLVTLLNDNQHVIPPLMQVSQKTQSESTSSKAYSDAVSAVKATVCEQAIKAINTPKPVSVPPTTDKPLFPIKDDPNKKKESSEENEGTKESTNTQSKVSDIELKERLLKFKTLSRDEQQSLIALLKELEGKEPERVEKLRKYVTSSLAQGATTTNQPSKTEVENSRLSPFSSRAAGGTNPTPGERGKPTTLINSDFDDDDEDDDDYSVEDVYKSVREKLKKKETEKRPEPRLNQLELLDENSSSSRYSNPTRPLSPTRFQNKNANPPDKRELLITNKQNTFPGPVTPNMQFPPPVPQGYGWPSSRYDKPGDDVNNYQQPMQPQQQEYYGGEQNQGYQNQNNSYLGRGYQQGPPPPVNRQQYPPEGQYPNYQQQQQQQPPYQQPPYNNYQQAPPGQGYYGNYGQY